MSTGTELVMLLRGRAPLAVAMTASAQPNKVLTPRTTVARSKSGVSGRNIMYFIRGVSDHPTLKDEGALNMLLKPTEPPDSGGDTAPGAYQRAR